MARSGKKKQKAAEAVSRSRYHVEALARGLQVLGVFGAAQPRLGVKEIADRTGLLPSTTFRIVMTLCDLGYLVSDGGQSQFRLGMKSVLLGYTALSTLNLEDLALPVLQRLFRDLEESTVLSVLTDDHATDIVSLRRPGLLQTRGQRFPLYCTPGGKILLAFMPPQQRSSLLGRLDLVRHARHTLTDRAALEKEILAVRETGYAMVEEEWVPGICGAGAPIFDAQDNCIATVVLTAPVQRVSPADLKEKMVPKLIKAASDISELMRRHRLPIQIAVD